MATADVVIHKFTSVSYYTQIVCTLTPPPPSSAGSDALVYVNVVVSRGKEEQKGGPETCARVLPRKTHTRAHAQEWSKKQKEKETETEKVRKTIAREMW